MSVTAVVDITTAELKSTGCVPLIWNKQTQDLSPNTEQETKQIYIKMADGNDEIEKIPPDTAE